MCEREREGGRGEWWRQRGVERKREPLLTEMPRQSVSRDDSLYRRHFLATRQRLGLTREAWAGGWREGLATMGRASGSCLLLTDLGTVEWAASRSRTKGREISAAEALERIVTKF